MDRPKFVSEWGQLMAEKPIFGNWRVAEYLGISEEGLRLRRKKPEWTFVQVGPAPVDTGQAVWSFPSSLDCAQRQHDQRVSEQRRLAVRKRWAKGVTDATSGDNMP